MTDTKTPAPQASDLRTENGQFAKGRSGNPAGHKPAIDFTSTIKRLAKEKGYDLEAATWEVFQRVHDDACEPGNVQSQKLYLDRVCGLQRQPVDIQSDKPLAAIVVVPNPMLAGEWETYRDKLHGIDQDLELRRNGSGEN